jgi:hypothetical protein
LQIYRFLLPSPLMVPECNPTELAAFGNHNTPVAGSCHRRFLDQKRVTANLEVTVVSICGALDPTCVTTYRMTRLIASKGIDAKARLHEAAVAEAR